MRHSVTTVLVLGVIGFGSPNAQAIALTNRDAIDRKITVIEGDKQTDRLIKPQEKIEICPQSCVIRMPTGAGSDDYEFDGSELVLIEDGLLILDLQEEQAKSNR